MECTITNDYLEINTISKKSILITGTNPHIKIIIELFALLKSTNTPKAKYSLA